MCYPAFPRTLAVILFINASPLTNAAHVHQKLILVFGGNGFIGSETLLSLLRQKHDIIAVSRGNWYWDAGDRVRPYVKHISCDRMETLNKCDAFVRFVKNRGEFVFFDVVIDFSGYHPFAVRDALKLMGRRFGLYIYVSTDSVYDLSTSKVGHGSNREEDAARINNEDDGNRESYGDRKLQCEEVLEFARTVGGPPFIILRLPDVIGPRDSTWRWWIYQLWIKLNQYVDKPISIPSHLVNQPISLVYVNNVADILSDLVGVSPSVYNETFNLAFSETITLQELLDEMKYRLNLHLLSIPVKLSNESIFLYPSVTSGPINSDKAVRLLNWSPTPIKEAIKQTVAFYESAMRDPQFAEPRNQVVRQLIGHLSDDQNGRKILAGVLNEYGIRLASSREDL